MKCRTCSQPDADNGEGWDGECGNCADATYGREVDDSRHECGLDRTFCNGCDVELEVGQVGKCSICLDKENDMGYGPVTPGGKQLPITPWKGSWAQEQEERRLNPHRAPKLGLVMPVERKKSDDTEGGSCD
ncbi:hypothetical protein LP414_27550 [Polaromonas sp. P1(28)-13]|nr:hypothetical protein LP414_27550 [Polaromonas sp. P1(28)-13]